MDFLRIRPKVIRKGLVEIAPKFVVKSSKDLMIRGGTFYAVWDERNGIWSTKQDDVVDMVDAELERYAEKYRKDYPDDVVIVQYMWDSDSKSIDKWLKYVKNQMADCYHPLDETLVFADSPIRKEDYATKRLPYSLTPGDHKAWDELTGKLYSPAELHKIEWSIGCVLSGDSKTLQKFVVLYGEGGTGKGTILEIISWLFDGYCATFESKALGSSSNAFSLEAFNGNPLVAIDGDGDLSRIEDNTKLNSLVSHEKVVVNEKFKKQYTANFKAMLFVGTNKPVKITDTRSGIIRRLIDVGPTGELFSKTKYDRLMKQVKFELGAIAAHCLEVYQEDPHYYDRYVPLSMIGATNDFFNFMSENFDIFYEEDSTTLGWAWTKYCEYCAEAKVPYPYQKRIVKEELKGYFCDFKEQTRLETGERVWNYYSGFRTEKFGINRKEDEKVRADGERSDESEHDIFGADCPDWLRLKPASEFEGNKFDILFADCPAQYATRGENEKPTMGWDDVRTTLKELDTSRVHYVMIPVNYISVDFDKKGKDGKKSLAENLKAAASWPKTYAEVSKGGQGLHLEYQYTGDASELSRIFEPDVEIKVSVGKSSLRRRLSLCNDIPITTISSGLPKREVRKNVVDENVMKNEKMLRSFIRNCVKKKHHGATAPEVQFIYDTLEQCYAGGLEYDVSDLKDDIYAFAANSTHQSAKCRRLVEKMKFCSEEQSKAVDGYSEDSVYMFFDVEVFPNLFVFCYKRAGAEKGTALINPDGKTLYQLFNDPKLKWIGFNNLKYDNPICYARIQGYTLYQLYGLSQQMIVEKIRPPYSSKDLSFTDIYDFASAGNKMSLKKWEIRLGVHHQELGLPWDKVVSPELWSKVAAYCLNDVDATEALFHHGPIQADFTAREILADLAGMTPNDTTNNLTTRIIFGDDREPQKKFVYTDLSTLFPGYEFDDHTPHEIPPEKEGEKPVFYRGIDRARYSGKIVNGKSLYRGEDPSEGGRVFSTPGIWFHVALLDIASMHPSSIEALNLFGPYTKKFSEIKQARILIKHKEFDKAKKIFDGKLAKYLDDPKQAKALSNALKTAINSVYGLTSAKFDNKFRDPRNADNIVAKRGALFMIELQKTLEEQGWTVAHVKTDSIKIPEATEEVIKFVTEFGQKYGYTFEHEATYDRMCLVNESVYVARYSDGPHEFELSTGEKLMTPWTATGAQFQIPYVFKTLFSHDPIVFEDLCETKSVTSALYLDFNEDLPDVSDAEKELDKYMKDAKASGVDTKALLEDPVPGSELDILLRRIEVGHKRQFIGRVGLFCPMKPGCGGGLLVREKDGKFNAATGTKGYRWMEAETVRLMRLEDQIDRGYYDRLVDEAVKTIEQFGDFEMFVGE